jgi:flagellar hook-associated protein 2
MAGLNLSGLASGMDTDTVIAQLMQIEARSRTRLAGQQTRAEGRQSALNDIGTKLRALKTAVDDLRSVVSWANVQTVESSNATYVGARFLAGAAPGSAVITVSQLARADQHFYAYSAPGAAARLTFTGAFPGSIVVDIPAGATKEQAAAAINAKTDAPAFASVVDGELVLSGKKTGEDFEVTSDVPGVLTASVDHARRNSLLANYKIDGVSQTASKTNVVNGLPGVELTLKAVTTDPVTVNVGVPGPDQTALKAKVKAFVDAYNSTIDLVSAKLDEQTARNPTTAADWKKGVLRGDPALSAVLSQLRGAMGAIVKVPAPGPALPTSYDALSDIGISVPVAQTSGAVSKDRLQGKLVIDDKKLTDALTADPNAVRKMLSGDGTFDGFTQVVDKVLDPIASIGTGDLAKRSSQADREIARVKDALAAFDLRLASKEKRLRAQFTAMEKALSASQSSMSWLSAQTAGLGTSSG